MIYQSLTPISPDKPSFAVDEMLVTINDAVLGLHVLMSSNMSPCFHNHGQDQFIN